LAAIAYALLRAVVRRVVRESWNARCMIRTRSVRSIAVNWTVARSGPYARTTRN
jgi:hypothetical protein